MSALKLIGFLVILDGLMSFIHFKRKQEITEKMITRINKRRLKEEEKIFISKVLYKLEQLGRIGRIMLGITLMML